MPFKVVPVKKLDLSVIASRKDERATTKATDGKRKIPLKNIVAAEGFNFMRTEADFDPVELGALADSFIAIGIQEQPKVLLLPDGTAVLIDGERRVRAAWIAHDRSPELAKQFAEIECILVSKNCSHADRLLMMLSTQSRKMFAPFKEAEAYRRLREGYMGDAPKTPAEIALHVNKPLAYVEQRLILSDETPEMKDMALTGKIKPTALVALNRLEKDPEKRIEQVKAENSKGKRYQVKNAIHAPGVDLLIECHSILDTVLNVYNIDGEHMNLILEVQAKMLAVKNIIQ